MSNEGKPLTVDLESFQDEVIQSEVPVLIDFWAPWCAPCQAIAPTIDALATDLRGIAKVVKVDVDQSPELALKYSVQSIPTLVFIRDGSEVDRIVGTAARQVLETRLKELADAA